MDRSDTEIKACSVESQSVDVRLKKFFSNDKETSNPIFDEIKRFTHRYEDYTEIARGGLKCIFSVFDKFTGRYVAMAKLHTKDSEKYEAFLREARLTASLEHPNIIKVHDIDIDDQNEPYFTMDLKKGPNLSNFLKDNKLDLRQLLIIFIKICDAIDYAHSRGVLHLDLKPANIQIGKYGEVIICDWGLGKIIDSESFSEFKSNSSDILNDMTLHGKIKGTPGFMAPEQIISEEKTVHTDIYALGALLYELSTGEKPFSGDFEVILEKTMLGDFQDPSEVNKAIPKSLEAVVLKAMEIDKADRYQTINELKKDVQSYLSGFATNAEDAGLVKIISLLIKRNTASFIVSCLAFIILIFATSLFIHRLQSEKRVAFRERDRANNLSRSELFARFKAEQTAKDLLKLNKKYLAELTEQSSFITENINHWDVYSSEIYENALSKLNKALETNSKNVIAKTERALLLVIMQSYTKALEDIFELPKLKYLEPVCIKGAEFNKDGVLDAGEMIKLLDSMNNIDKSRKYKKSLIDKILAFDRVSHNRESDDYVLITSQLIKIWNKDWNGSLIFNSRNRQLTITGKGLKILRTTQNNSTTKHNILRFLKPLSLKLQGTSLVNLYHVADMSLKDLDISRNSFRNFKPNQLSLFKNISTLFVNKEQYKLISNVHEPSWITYRIKE